MHEGDGVRLTLLLSDGGQPEKRALVISADAYFEAGKPSAGMALSAEAFEQLADAAARYAAIREGLYLLTYSDNSRAKLVSKLRVRGHAKRYAEEAAEYLVKKGYIDEREQLRQEILRLANQKLYGKRRIVAELYQKRYDLTLVREVYAECIDSIDFEANKRRLLEKKFGTARPKPASAAEYAKIKAFLYRYGY